MDSEVNHTMDTRRAAKEQDKALEILTAPLKPWLQMQVAILRMWAGGFEHTAKAIETKLD